MAYFSKGDYEVALLDFEKSERADPNNFRAYYYRGITLVMLGRNREAIDEYTRSLELKANQGHVYFRRALSYYSVGLYIEALQDIDVAENLGLNDGQVKKLRVAIAKKIDIV